MLQVDNCYVRLSLRLVKLLIHVTSKPAIEAPVLLIIERSLTLFTLVELRHPKYYPSEELREKKVITFYFISNVECNILNNMAFSEWITQF